MPSRRDLLNLTAVWFMGCASLLLKKKRRKRRIKARNEHHQQPKTDGACTTTTTTTTTITTIFVPVLQIDPSSHFTHFLMNAERLEKLLGIVGPHLANSSVNFGAVNAGDRLCLTLRYLTSGASMPDLTVEYKLSKTTISKIVEEVCQVIWDHLFPIYVDKPSEANWEAVATDMERLWNVPNCIGSIDGKNVLLRVPPKNGSSMVIMAACDAHWCFTLIDVGCHDSISNGSIFATSANGQQRLCEALQLPQPKQLPRTRTVIPHYFVANIGFPLLSNLMRPFPAYHPHNDKKAFNKHLSKAQILIENVFGILAARWRIYRNPIPECFESTEKIIKATCILHNFIMKEDMALTNFQRMYCPPKYADHIVENSIVDGDWRDEVRGGCALTQLHCAGSNNVSKNAVDIRQRLSEYFFSNKLCSTVA